MTTFPHLKQNRNLSNHDEKRMLRDGLCATCGAPNPAPMTAKDAIAELDRLVPESVPTIKLEDIARDWLDFYQKLQLAEIPMPYWLEIGKARYKITKENYESVARGMLIGLEIRAHKP